MTDYEISSLSEQIRTLNSTVSSLERAISRADEKLFSLDSRLRDFWINFWASVLVVATPLVVLMATAAKHP
jgi:hypothetical protein